MSPPDAHGNEPAAFHLRLDGTPGQYGEGLGSGDDMSGLSLSSGAEPLPEPDFASDSAFIPGLEPEAAPEAEPSAEVFGVAREEVIVAFELLLGRPPESEATILEHMRMTDRVALGEALRHSSEFRFRNAPDRRPPGAAPGRRAEADCTTLASYRFGQGGNVAPFLRDGWSVPDAAACWSTGTTSELNLPVPPHPDGQDVALTITLEPFNPPQRLSILLGDTRLVSVLARGPLDLGCRIPHALLAGGSTLQLTLLHPDAARPCDLGTSGDKRWLGFAARSLALATLPRYAEPRVLSDADLLLHFESLGDNCEFGFVQRRCGVGAAGLLRFNTMPHDQLLHGLATRFEGFPDRARMRLEQHPTRTGSVENIVYEDGYRFSGHTVVPHTIDATWSEADAETLLDREHARLGFLKRLLLEELEGDETILVFKRNVPPSQAQVMALWLAIRRLGRCTLLWVAPEEPDAPAGTVTKVAEGLLKAHIDRFAPYDNAEDLSLACWLGICRQALALSGIDVCGNDVS